MDMNAVKEFSVDELWTKPSELVTCPWCGTYYHSTTTLHTGFYGGYHTVRNRKCPICGH